jgi:hypothetical protein
MLPIGVGDFERLDCVEVLVNCAVANLDLFANDFFTVVPQHLHEGIDVLETVICIIESEIVPEY